MKNASNTPYYDEDSKVNQQLLQKTIGIIMQYFDDIDPTQIHDVKKVLEHQYFCFYVGTDPSLYSCPTKPLSQLRSSTEIVRDYEYEFDPEVNGVLRYERAEVRQILEGKPHPTSRDEILTDLNFQKAFWHFYPNFSINRIEEISLLNHRYHFTYQGMDCICPDALPA